MKKLAASIFIPFLVMAAWMLKMTAQVQFGQEIELKVGGFDPRDLLAGHYLRFRVDWGGEVSCVDRGPKVQCVCVENQKATFVGACDEVPPTCPAYVRGQCRYRTLNTGLDRYYFPESFKHQLRVTPEKSTIKVRVDGRGNAIVTDFLVDGVPILDHVRKTQ